MEEKLFKKEYSQYSLHLKVEDFKHLTVHIQKMIKIEQLIFFCHIKNNREEHIEYSLADIEHIEPINFLEIRVGAKRKEDDESPKLQCTIHMSRQQLTVEVNGTDKKEVGKLNDELQIFFSNRKPLYAYIEIFFIIFVTMILLALLAHQIVQNTSPLFYIFTLLSTTIPLIFSQKKLLRKAFPFTTIKVKE